MRVISGKYRGMNIDGFDIDGTRPTMDRVKESMFAMIQDKIIDSTCLDLFAGSGSLGIEALSNGAKFCYFVDKHNIIYKILQNNLKKLKDNNYNLMNLDYKKALDYYSNNNIKFDVIILDPPYKYNLINDCLNKIYEYNLLNENGIIICEYESEIIENSNYNLIKQKKYGTKFVNIYTLIK